MRAKLIGWSRSNPYKQIRRVQRFTPSMNAPFPMRGMLRPLRPYQKEAFDALRRSLATGHIRPMLQLPTGAGKTLLSAHIIKNALDKGKRVAFVVPALSLIDQTVAAFEAEGVHCVGVMQGYHERTDHTQPVQVCSIQTLARRRKPVVDFVIVDEAHVLHKSFLRWGAELAKTRIPVIGLSATPWTRGLGKHYDDLVIAATTLQLISDGYLSDFVAFAPSDPDLSDVSTVAGDFKQDELADAMDKVAITGDIVATWQKRGKNRPALAYCVNRRHAQHICERFIEAGVPAEYMDGETKRKDREETFDRFRSGETKVICNVGVLTTGIDLDVRCVIDAKPTKSKMLFVQTIGRGLRTAPGKDKLVILDHAGNHLRLGMVTDIGQDKLDDGSPRSDSERKASEKAQPLPCRCKACKAVMPREAKVCPACGEEVFVASTVRVATGELVELGARQSGKVAPADWEKKVFFCELMALRKPQYKSGWASAHFREKFGHWPPREWASLPTLSPSLNTRNWLKSRQIAFAKRRAS